jgi:hypothetical protein
VIECINCKKIQVGFGNLLLSFDSAGFDHFRLRIEKWFDGCNEADDHIKNIIAKTQSEEVQLLLSKSELAGLQQMIEYADTEMKTSKLLELFSSPAGNG